MVTPLPTVPLLRYLPVRSYGYPAEGDTSSTTTEPSLFFSSGEIAPCLVVCVVFELVDHTYSLRSESRANSALSVSLPVLARRGFAPTAGLQRL